MKKFALLAVFLALPFVAFGQTAKVIALSPADAQLAKDLNDQQAALTKKIADFKESVQRTYLETDVSGQYATSKSTLAWRSGRWVKLSYFKDGWGFGGFQFSEDFKFIVPLIPTSSVSFGANCGGLCYSGCGATFSVQPVGSITALTPGTLY